MSIPLPPLRKESEEDVTPVTEPSTLTQSPSGDLTENESSYILDRTLSEKNRNDPRVIAFIDSFIVCRSIPQASAEAGIERKLGYSFRHRKDIANAIQKITDKSAVKHGFDASEIFERVKEVVEFDPVNLQNCDGTYKSNLHDIDPETRRCLKKLKVKNLYNQVEDINGMKRQIIIGELIEYDFYDKLKAAELTGKEKEMFKNTTKVEHTVSADMATLLLDSTKRAEKRLAPREVEGTIVDVTPDGELV